MTEIMTQQTGKRVLFTRKFNDQLLKSCYASIKNWLREFATFPDGSQSYEENKTKQTIIYNGNEIIFKCYEDPEDAKSIDYNYVIFEEASEQIPSVFAELKVRNRLENTTPCNGHDDDSDTGKCDEEIDYPDVICKDCDTRNTNKAIVYGCKSCGGFDFLREWSCGKCGHKERDVMKLRNGGVNQMFLIFNPISDTNWLYYEFEPLIGNDMIDLKKKDVHAYNKVADDMKDELRHLFVTWEDNEKLGFDEVKKVKLLKENNYSKYLVDYMGHWGASGGVIFDHVKVRRFDLDPMEYALEYGGVRNGGDFGKSNDPHAFILTMYDPAIERLYVVKEFYSNDPTEGESNDLRVYAPLHENDLCRELDSKFGRNFNMLCDNAEPQMIRQMQDSGLPALPCKIPKEGRLVFFEWM